MIFAFLRPLSGRQHRQIARTCRAFRFLLASIAALPEPAAAVASSSQPRPRPSLQSAASPPHSPRLRPPGSRASWASPPSTLKLQKSLILQAHATGIPVEHIISDPWWQLDQDTVDLVRQTLLTLLTPPRSPFARDEPPLPLSPREVDKWRRLMASVDKGYVKQLRRRRLRAKQEAGVRGEEVDAIARLDRSGSAVDLSVHVDPAPPQSPSLSASSPLSPGVPGHCFMVPPIPPFIPAAAPSTLSFWQQQVIPRWATMETHSLTQRLWGKEGIPALCRWDVWSRKLGREGGGSSSEREFRKCWRGERVDVEEEEKGEEPDDNGSPRRPVDPSDPSLRDRHSTSSNASTPSSPSSPSTPLPDTVHAFSLPAVALTAAESSIHNTLSDDSAAHSRRASIQNDLLRMFDPEHLADLDALDGLRASLSLPPVFSSLHSLLATFAYYQPETSYVQGMSYMSLLLLLYMPVVDAFAALCALIKHDWYDAYTNMNVAAMQSRCRAFSALLHHNRPRLALHLQALPPDTYFIEWMLTFYIPLLSFAFTSALFDLYLLRGEEVIYRAGVALLMLGEAELLSMPVLECSQWLRGGMKDAGVDEEQLWRVMTTVDFPPLTKAFFSKTKQRKSAGAL